MSLLIVSVTYHKAGVLPVSGAYWCIETINGGMARWMVVESKPVFHYSDCLNGAIVAASAALGCEYLRRM